MTISDGSRTTATNTNGDYTLSNVPAGSYTLTPSRSGYTFSPASLSMTVSGNLTGRNFTGTPENSAGTVNLALVPSANTLGVGSTINVALEVRSGTLPIDGAAFFINFDPALIEVLDFTPTTQLSLELMRRIDNASGQVDLVRGSLSSPFPQGTFTLGTLSIKARIASTTPTTLALSSAPGRQSDVTSSGSSVLGQLIPASLTIVTGSNLDVAVQLDGRPTGPNPLLSVPLAVTLGRDGSPDPIRHAQPNTDQNGRFRFDGLANGTYRLTIKHAQSLRVQATQTIQGADATLQVGPLPMGDANNDNQINLQDFSILAASFGKSSTGTGYDGRADFNGDRSVNLQDFSLLAKNFNKAGVAAQATPSAEPSALAAFNILSHVTREVRAGETFTVSITIQAPATGIDGAAAYLYLDPALLEIVQITSNSPLDLELQQDFDNATGQIGIARGTLNASLPSGEVPVATLTLHARVQTNAATIQLVDDGAQRVSMITAKGDILTANEATWLLGVAPTSEPQPTQFKVFLPAVNR
ncbi:MAG: dockerin type I domain-containing protein [Oscillochloridaceae bacterium umkhey_bin13]